MTHPKGTSYSETEKLVPTLYPGLSLHPVFGKTQWKENPGVSRCAQSKTSAAILSATWAHVLRSPGVKVPVYQVENCVSCHVKIQICLSPRGTVTVKFKSSYHHDTHLTHRVKGSSTHHTWTIHPSVSLVLYEKHFHPSPEG